MSVGSLSVACCTWVPCCLSAIQNIHYLCIRDLSINLSIYISCLWDSSGESIDNNWENNIHQAIYKISLPLHQRAPTANQTDAAAVLRQNGNNQNAHMFNSDHTPALMLASLQQPGSCPPGLPCWLTWRGSHLCLAHQRTPAHAGARPHILLPGHMCMQTWTVSRAL